MENFFKNVIRKKLIFSNNELEISGTSMEPCLLNDDIIKIASEVSYSTGDILVFTYDNTILVHRLIKIVNQFYYCKGDNSFRTEMVNYDDILGKVILVNGREVPLLPECLLDSSIKIGRLYEVIKDIDTIRNMEDFQKYISELQAVYVR